MKSARIVITKKCNRTCHYCCNEKEGTFDGATKLDTTINFESMVPVMEQFKNNGFGAVVISGGEPMLQPETIKVIAAAARFNGLKVYLYSATWTKYTEDCIQNVDGINFTMHEAATLKDVNGFNRMQELATEYPEKSWRLNVHRNMEFPINIVPNVWNAVDFWMHMDECPLPQNEELFVL